MIPLRKQQKNLTQAGQMSEDQKRCFYGDGSKRLITFYANNKQSYANNKQSDLDNISHNTCSRMGPNSQNSLLFVQLGTGIKLM
jgi:hypothetical protein